MALLLRRINGFPKRRPTTFWDITPAPGLKASKKLLSDVFTSQFIDTNYSASCIFHGKFRVDVKG